MSARRAALAGAVARLTVAGVADPARDARLLLAEAVGVPADRLNLYMDQGLDAAEQARFETLVAARAARQPVAQILGRRMFWGRWFKVTRDVLDPRPETETLIAAALEARFARVLDLGTGSGAIVLSLLAERLGASGVGVDLSPAALAVAQENARALGVADRVALQPGNWCAGLEGPFDLIVSNPPYIAADEMPGLAPETRDWEPALALTPGGDGLDAYRAIAAQAGQVAGPGARILLEIGPTQAAAVTGLLAARGWVDLRVVPDLDGRDRVVAGVWPARGATFAQRAGSRRGS
jgi:release factor glutamine methyltransferase